MEYFLSETRKMSANVQRKLEFPVRKSSRLSKSGTPKKALDSPRNTGSGRKTRNKKAEASLKEDDLSSPRKRHSDGNCCYSFIIVFKLPVFYSEISTEDRVFCHILCENIIFLCQ